MSIDEPGQAPAPLDMSDWSEQERGWHHFDAMEGNAANIPDLPERTRLGKVIGALESLVNATIPGSWR